MVVDIIKYYKDDICISKFVGNSDTIAEAFFHMNFYKLIPYNFVVTKTTNEHKEYVLNFTHGGFSWIEVQLNRPSKELV